MCAKSRHGEDNVWFRGSLGEVVVAEGCYLDEPLSRVGRWEHPCRRSDITSLSGDRVGGMFYAVCIGELKYRLLVGHRGLALFSEVGSSAARGCTLKCPVYGPFDCMGPSTAALPRGTSILLSM